MGHHSEAFIGIDTSKSRNAVAIADGGRGGEVRFLGEFPTTEAATRRCQACGKIRQADVLLRGRADGVRAHRLIKSLGDECIVAAPSLIPYGQNIGAAEEPVLHRAIELAGAQSWGEG